MNVRDGTDVIDIERLQRAEASLHAFLENIDEMACSLDRNFRYINLSRALRVKLKEDFGVDAKPGDKLYGILKKIDREAIGEWQEIYAKALKGETMKFVKEFTYSGKSETWSFSIGPIWQRGAITGVTCFSRNVSEIQRVREALRSLKGSQPYSARKKKPRPVQAAVNLNADTAEKLSSVFEFIFREWRGQLTNKNVIIIAKILNLLSQYDAGLPNNGLRSAGLQPNPVIRQFNELLSRHYKKQRTVKFYARELHVHPFYLNSLAKRHTGSTAKELITNHIILEAKQLLASTPLTVKEISFKMGFEYPEHFYALFKRAVHLSPARYRAQDR